jgi:hypothetical protein
VLEEKSEWDERAKRNIRYYIAIAEYQTEEIFDASGVRHVSMILSDVERYFAADSIVLEIGCCIGRLQGPLSNRFKELYGVFNVSFCHMICKFYY